MATIPTRRQPPQSIRGSVSNWWKGGVDFARLAEIREELGLTGVTVTLPDDFDDPAYSRRVLGLDP